jgi:hypothetical protein
MSRSLPKNRGKGNAPPRREHFDDGEDDRPGPRGYRMDDAMDVEYGDDRRDERHNDRGGDPRDARRAESRDDDWDERRETRRDDNRGPVRYDHPDDRREGASEGLITQYFPTAGIEWEVIAGDIQIYLGPEASVKIGPDPEVRGIFRDESVLLLTFYRIAGEWHTGSRPRIIYLLRYVSPEYFHQYTERLD